MKRLLAVLIIPLLTEGCIHSMPSIVSSSGLGLSEHPLAMASGESSASYVLFFGPFGDDSLQAAVKDATDKQKADTLMNVFVDRRMLCIPHCGFSFFTRITTKVYGTLVKYDDPGFERSDGQSKAARSPKLAKNEMREVLETFRDGMNIKITFVDNSVKEGTFKNFSRASDTLWVKTRDTFYTDNAYNIRNLLKIEKE